jgi:uncharacterized protein (TIGR03435 family)
MSFRVSSRIGFAVSFLTVALAAQQPAPSTEARFEVVSIRPVPPDAPPIMRDIDFTPVLPGGQYIDPRTGLLFMISLAYNVEDPSIRLVGLPDWARSRGFAVSAKPAPDFPALPPAENLEQVRVMMRAMLEDRFHLQLHTEMRQGQVFNLEVARGGFKFKEVDPPVPPAREGPVGAAMGDDGGRMIGNKSTMPGLAKALVIFLKQPVIDQTGLKGYYDFDVKWNAPESPDGQRPGPRLGAEGIGLLLTTLEDQFGLRMTKAAGPVKYWVVDHVEPPTEN